MIKTLIFDFDGTLVDSMPTFSQITRGFLDEQRIPYGDDLINIITPLGYPGIAKYYAGLGVPMPEEEILRILDMRAVDAYTHRVPAKEHVIGVLRLLRERGFSLNVLTASPHSLLDPCLKRLEIFDLFDNVWSCDDFSTGKSDPNIYRMAAQRLGKAVDEILFLDDNIYANMTARSAGMVTCGVYDLSSHDRVEEIKEAANYYVYDFSQLPQLECFQ